MAQPTDNEITANAKALIIEKGLDPDELVRRSTVDDTLVPRYLRSGNIPFSQSELMRFLALAQITGMPMRLSIVEGFTPAANNGPLFIGETVYDSNNDFISADNVNVLANNLLANVWVQTDGTPNGEVWCQLPCDSGGVLDVRVFQDNTLIKWSIDANQLDPSLRNQPFRALLYGGR